MWCQEVTEILEGQSDAATPEEGLKAFEQVSFSRLNGLAALVRTNLPRLHRNNITALITVDVHARDIITDMVSHVGHRLQSWTVDSSVSNC